MEYYLNDSDIPIGIYDLMMLATAFVREEVLGLSTALIVLMREGFEVSMK